MIETFGVLAGVFSLLFAFETPRKIFLNLLRGKVRPTAKAVVVDNWLDAINKGFQNEVKIFCRTYHEPKIHIEGEYQLTDEQQVRAQEHRESLRNKGCVNDMHAVLVSEPNWDSSPVLMRVRTIDYAGIITLREQGECPEILSAGALLLSSHMGKLILHRRGSDVATYSNALHIFGGGYKPRSHGQGKDDGMSLKRTAYREIHEETGLGVPTGITAPMLLAKELSTGFIQFVYLGFDLEIGADIDVGGTWEGHIEMISYDVLPSLLKRPDWVPSGKAHVLAWLALGAPGCAESPKFGKKSSDQIFRDWIGSLPLDQTEK